MAVPTPISNAYQSGSDYVLSWHATWATTDNFSASAIIDRSGLTGSPTEIEVQGIWYQCTAGIDVRFDFNHDTNQLIHRSVIGFTNPVTVMPPVGRQGFRLNPGTRIQTAGQGDVLLTTTSAASSDVVSFVIWARLHGIAT